MAEFTKIEADIQLKTKDGGSISIHVEGCKVPDGARAIGEYFGGQVAAKLSGLTDAGIEGQKNQIAKLEKTVQDKDSEIRALEDEMKELKKAQRARRSTPST